MISPSTDYKELRRAPRMKLPAMYTLVRVTDATGSQRFDHAGYIYDISISGMRIELDMLLEEGTRIEAKLMLPGQPGEKKPTNITVTAWVVRHHDGEDESSGPTRMGVAFESFKTPQDEERLYDYVSRLNDEVD